MIKYYKIKIKWKKLFLKPIKISITNTNIMEKTFYFTLTFTQQ